MADTEKILFPREWFLSISSILETHASGDFLPPGFPQFREWGSPG